MKDCPVQDCEHKIHRSLLFCWKHTRVLSRAQYAAAKTSLEGFRSALRAIERADPIPRNEAPEQVSEQRRLLDTMALFEGRRELTSRTVATEFGISTSLARFYLRRLAERGDVSVRAEKFGRLVYTRKGKNAVCCG